jgi:hypothetical protein
MSSHICLRSITHVARFFFFLLLYSSIISFFFLSFFVVYKIETEVHRFELNEGKVVCSYCLACVVLSLKEAKQNQMTTT